MTTVRWWPRRRWLWGAVVLMVVLVGAWWWQSSPPPLPITDQWQPSGEGQYPLGFSRDGRALILADRPIGLIVRDLGTGAARRLFPSETFQGYRASLALDGRALADIALDPAGTTSRVVVLDLETGTILAEFPPEAPSSTWAAFSCDAKTLTVVTWDRSQTSAMPVVELWDTATWQRQAVLTPPASASPDRIDALACDGSALVGRDATNPCVAVLWSLPDFKRRTFTAVPAFPGAKAFGAQLSPDGTHLAAGLSDGHAWIWDVSSGRLERVLKGVPGYGTSYVAFSRNGRHAATVSVRNTPPPILQQLHDRLFGPSSSLPASYLMIALWDLDTGERLATLPGQDGPMFSPDGRLLVTFATDNTITLWRVPETAVKGQGQKGVVEAEP